MTMQRRVSWTEGARTVMTVHQMNPYEMFGFMIDSFLSAKDAETSSKVERLADALDNYITASTTNMTNGGDVFHECREFNDAQDVVFYDAIEPQSILAFTMPLNLKASWLLRCTRRCLLGSMQLFAASSSLVLATSRPMRFACQDNSVS